MGPSGEKLIHNLSPAAKCSDRQTAADHFAQYGQVRFDSVNFLGTAARNPETGDHFIENQKRAVFRAFTAQDRQEIFFRKIKSGVCGNRFQDDRSDFVFVFVERFSDKIDIIEWQRNGELGKGLWNTGAVGPSVGQCAAPSFVNPRANRMHDIAASVPLLTIRTFSIDGIH